MTEKKQLKTKKSTKSPALRKFPSVFISFMNNNEIVHSIYAIA